MSIPAGLGHLLHLERPNVTLLELTAPWGVDIEGCAQPGMYVVERGGMLAVGSETRIWAQAGDLLLLPAGGRHAVLHAPDAPRVPLATAYGARTTASRSSLASDGVRYGGPGPATRTYAVTFRGPPLPRALSRMMPSCVHVSRQTLDRTERHVTQALLDTCAVLDDSLSDEIVALTRYVWLRSLRRCCPDLAMTDHDWQVLATVAHIEAHPEAFHSVARLARRAGLGRSRFVERFRAFTGSAPMGYVFQVRMRRAHHLLATRAFGMSEVAESVGYTSEAAFRKAYKRFLTRTHTSVVDPSWGVGEPATTSVSRA